MTDNTSRPASMPPPAITVLEVRAGRIEPLGPDGQQSAINKLPVSGSMLLTRLGLEGDEQADRNHHGGYDKAFHHYPSEHYAAWRAELPGSALQFVPGGFGENLSTQGLTENNICIGDLFRLGNAIIQVSQARKPCAKLNIRFGADNMVRRVLDTGRSGWYYRVLEEGKIGAGDTLTLIERNHPGWTIARTLRVLYLDNPDKGALAELAEIEALAQKCRDLVGKRLADLQPV